MKLSLTIHVEGLDEQQRHKKYNACDACFLFVALRGVIKPEYSPLVGGHGHFTLHPVEAGSVDYSTNLFDGYTLSDFGYARVRDATSNFTVEVDIPEQYLLDSVVAAQGGAQ